MQKGPKMLNGARVMIETISQRFITTTNGDRYGLLLRNDHIDLHHAGPSVGDTLIAVTPSAGEIGAPFRVIIDGGCLCELGIIFLESRVDGPPYLRGELPMTKRFMMVVLAVLLAVGCAAPVWTKPGGTEADFARDKYACAQEAKVPYSSAYVNPYGGAAAGGVQIDRTLYNACMEARGWRLVRQKSN